MRGAGRGRPLRPDAPVAAARSVARAARRRGGDRGTRCAGWRLLLDCQAELLEPRVPEHVAQLDLADVEDAQRAAGGRPAAARRRLEAQLVDPQRAVGDRDREGGAEERLEVEARPGGGDRHRLEDAPPRPVQEDARGSAHLGADAPAGREVRVGDLRPPRTSRAAS